MTDSSDPDAFRGPYADGVPPSALAVEAPELDALSWRHLGRLVTVVSVLVWSVLSALFVGVVRAERRGVATVACHGLIDAFIKLGPTYVKLGQIIASSSGLFPQVLATAARRCLDEVPPFPTAEVHRTIAEDLGAPVHEVFASFDDTPLSAASIGQVHACTLRDGRDAVVKVQRPNIHERMTTDLRIAYRVAGWMEKTPWLKNSGAKDAIEDLHAVTFDELNPAREAWQQERFRSKIHDFGDNTGIIAPEVYWDHCGPHTICMQRVYGIPMDHFDEIEERGIDGQAVLRRGAKVWAEAVMVHGPYHGDMHAGNIWVLDDGRGCFLDFGIMGELEPEWKDLLRDIFYTCAFDQDFVRVAQAYRRVGVIPPGVGSDEDLAAMLNGILGPMITDGFGGIDIALLVNQSMEMMKTYEASVPQPMLLIAKQLLYIDRYTKRLAADYSITSDPFIMKNVFPEESAKLAAELGVVLDDTDPDFAPPKRERTAP